MISYETDGDRRSMDGTTPFLRYACNGVQSVFPFSVAQPSLIVGYVVVVYVYTHVLTSSKICVTPSVWTPVRKIARGTERWVGT